jgi:hypothetical protein
MNDMLLKRCNFQIQIYDSEVKMQSFTVCTKLLIKIQKTKMPSNAKCLFFFCIFNILKLKMHGLKSNLIYKPIVYKRKTTQAGYSAPSTIPYSGLYGHGLFHYWPYSTIEEHTVLLQQFHTMVMREHEHLWRER